VSDSIKYRLLGFLPIGVWLAVCFWRTLGDSLWDSVGSYFFRFFRGHPPIEPLLDRPFWGSLFAPVRMDAFFGSTAMAVSKYPRTIAWAVYLFAVVKHFVGRSLISDAFSYQQYLCFREPLTFSLSRGSRGFLFRFSGV